MKAGRNIFLFIFWILAAIDLYAVVRADDNLHMVFKPTLMTSLIFLICLTKANGYKKPLILWALIFSLAGDIFLMFENINSLNFILGLASFLVAHIFYIIFFLTLEGPKSLVFRNKPWIVFIIAAYVTGLMLIILPHTGSLKVPVLLYAVIISTMLISSILIINTVPAQAAGLFVSGAISFVISDSLLAINKFYFPLRSFAFTIMLTYCIAQFLIVTGFIKLSSLRFNK